mmetsp:Transcript_106269/g.307722  ORF Transcript_106269/g.307722 Transcript_106269/m.307722 type:complete len:206 (-) Transcript_106269:12243-12860(-)
MGPSTRSRRSWSTSTVYERRMPACRPAGGSFVTFVDICSRPSGNSGCGRAVMKRRKLGSRPVSTNFRMICSIWSMSSSMSSQFCRRTHVPSVEAACIAFMATTSWPSPSEITAGPGSLRLRARPSMPSVGSAPRERRKITGTSARISAKIISCVSVTGSTKVGPSCDVLRTNSRVLRMDRSIRSERTSRSLRNGPISGCSARRFS